MEAVSSIAFWTTTVLLCLAVLFTAWVGPLPGRERLSLSLANTKAAQTPAYITADTTSA